MDMNDISKLASLLRENGDKVLNALSKLSLTASLLQNLNEAFCLIVEQNEEDNSSFHVINTNNSKVELFHDLQFLHDFVQKVVGLKVSHSTPLTSETFKSTLDISKFRNLKFLELRKVPIHLVNGIQSIRAQLQSIICVRCLQNLQELLSSCGADHSSGFVWSELREAVFSYNGIETLDSSLTYTPWLQIVDLSHNRIKNVEAIDCLPNLKYLNISYNLLYSLPVFNKEASHKLQVLVLKNNYIEDLSGLSSLESLSELDLSCNCLTDHDCLLPLLKLSALIWLSLEGNPLSFHSQHRLRTARYLHSNTASGKFLLDRVPLSKSERLQVGTLSSSPVPRRVPAFCDDISSHSASSSSTSTKTQVAVTPEPQIAAVPVSRPQVTRRSRQVREAIISEHDGSLEEDTSTLTGSLEVSMEQAEHLETKRRIETLREQFGEDNWLHSHGGSCVQDVLGLPPAPPSILPVLVTELSLQSETLDPEPTKPGAPVDFPDMVQDLPSKDVPVPELEETDSRASKEGSPETEQYYEEDREEEEEGEVEGQLYMVQRMQLGVEAAEELFLVVSDWQLKERDTRSGRTMERWGMDALQSCVRTRSDPPMVQLTFDTVRRDRQEREYVLEEEDAQKLVRTLAEVLSSRPLMAMNQAAFRCMKCSAQFSQELLPSPIASVIVPPVTASPGKKYPLPKDPMTKVLTCPTCGSTMVIEMDEEPLPATQLVIPASARKDKLLSQPTSAPTLTQSPSQSSIGQHGDELDGDRLHSSSAVHGEPSQLAAAPSRSAASLDSPGGSTVAACRYDSDIEVISNPSQSSIEVLDGDTRTPSRKRSSEERQTVVVQSAAPSVDPVCHVTGLTGLTESSSSGSLTDSVCTTYENHTSATPSKTSANHHAEERVRHLSSESGPPAVKENGSSNSCKLPDVVSIPARKRPESNGTPEKSRLFHEPHSPVMNFTTMFQGLLHSVSSKLVPSSPGKIASISSLTSPNEVVYSYDNFGRVDHRIKLYLYQSVFIDEQEELCLLLRAEVLMQPTSCPFPGCLVLSSQKVYILKITGKEGDDPEHWLSKYESLTLSQLQVVFVLPWGQGVGLEVKDTTPRRILFLLQDAQRTSNLFSSLAESPLPKTCELKDEPPDYHQLTVRQFLLSFSASGEGDSVVRMLTIFTHCTVCDNKETQLGMGALLITTSDLLLTGTDLQWLFPGCVSPMSSHSSQKMNDLIELELSGLILTLQFIDETAGREESWRVSLRTDDAVQMVIAAIRAPWEELFSVPLQVTERDQC